MSHVVSNQSNHFLALTFNLCAFGFETEQIGVRKLVTCQGVRTEQNTKRPVTL